MHGLESVPGPDPLDAGVVRLRGHDQAPARTGVLDRGEQVTVPAAALLGRGTGSVVAPVVPVFDHPTTNLMVRYHKRLAGGCSPAVALADAQVTAASGGPDGWSIAAGFVCIGAA